MANLTADDKHVLKILFERPRFDKVLDFDDNAFVDFFKKEVNIDITDHPYYVMREREYVSWANQIACLRKFCDAESDQTVGKIIELLVNRAKRLCEDGKEEINPARIEEGYAIARRLQGVLSHHIYSIAKNMLKNPPHSMATQRGISDIGYSFPSSLALSLQKRAEDMAILGKSIYSPEAIKMMERERSYREYLREQLRPIEESREKFRALMQETDGILGGYRSHRSSRQKKEPQDFTMYRPVEVFEKNVEVRKEKEFESIADSIDEIDFDKFPVDEHIKSTLKVRLNEAVMCFDKGIYFPAVTTAGAVLECVLLGYAMRFPQKFNQSKVCPKNKSGDTLQFSQWGLSRLIDAARELGFINKTVQQLCYCVRNYRNYIHPHEQLHGDDLTKEIADISLRILFHTLRSLMAK